MAEQTSKTQRPVSYEGGPFGGQTALIEVGTTDRDGDGRLDNRVELPGGHYELGERESSTVGESTTEQVYRWVADPERRDRTPRDGDEASALLAEHDGATPILDQEVTSSIMVSTGSQVRTPEAQDKTVTRTEQAKRGAKPTGDADSAHKDSSVHTDHARKGAK